MEEKTSPQQKMFIILVLDIALMLYYVIIYGFTLKSPVLFSVIMGATVAVIYSYYHTKYIHNNPKNHR